MGWTIRLGGASGMTFSSSTARGRELKFRPQPERIFNAKGDTEGYKYTFEIEGDIVDSTALLVAQGFVDLTAEITAQGARQFEAILDGTPYFDISPGSCFSGPFVTRVVPVDDEGNGESHWRYALTVEAVVKKASSLFLDTSLQIDSNAKGDIVRKIWKASCKAKTADSAWNVILSFKPSGETITQSYIRRFQLAEAEAEWVWEAERTVGGKKVESWECTVMVTGGADTYTGDPQVGGAGARPGAVLHLDLLSPARYEVRGTLIGFSADLKPPGEHFTRADDMVRAVGEEQEQLGATIHDPEKGTYILHYHEIWYSDSPAKTPNHADAHNVIKVSAAPSDGAMG